MKRVVLEIKIWWKVGESRVTETGRIGGRNMGGMRKM